MTLDEAVNEFSSLFTSVVDGKPSKEVIQICSGGVCPHGDVAPALFSNEERAIKAWLETAKANVPPGSTELEWVSNPELVKYQITMADMRQRHRVAGDRFTVKAQFLARGSNG